MRRFEQIILIGTFLPFCWLAMMAIHELGHVLAALISGGSINKVVVHPLSISRTDVFPNPQPLFVVWAGPLVGVLLPLAAWALVARLLKPAEFLSRFFAGFCLVANGLYIGAGAFEKIGDPGDMLQHGSGYWHLGTFAILSVPLGFWLWHGLGPRFGLGHAKGNVDRQAVWISAILLTSVLITTMAISPRG